MSMLRCSVCNGTIVLAEDYELRTRSPQCLNCGRSPSPVTAEPIPTRPSPTGEPRVCAWCGETFYIYGGRHPNQKCCSGKCATTHRRNPVVQEVEA